MRTRSIKKAMALFAACFWFAPPAPANEHKQGQTKEGKHSQGKVVWNYDGGVFFETDGTLPNGVCFRVRGQAVSLDFFDDFKRVDTEKGTVFRRGTETVANFPESLTVSYSIRDESCPSELQQIGTRHYLTQAMMDDLRVTICWKHGVDLRPVKNIKLLSARVDRINPYAMALAAQLPARYEWSYKLVIPSAGVSLTESLCFIFRAPDGRISARVAARL